MRRPLLAAGAVLLLITAGCGGDPDPLTAEDRAACQEFTQVINDWGVDYGAEMGAVGQAVAAGDEARQDTAVPVVRELFSASAERLRTGADRAEDEELAEALGQAADGLAEIADQIETYDDVTAAPELMSDGAFAAAGERVSTRCAAADS